MTATTAAAPTQLNVGWVIGATFTVVSRRWRDLLLVGAPFVWLPSVLAGLASASLGGGGAAYALFAGLPGLVFVGGASLITYGELAGAPRVGAGEAIRRGASRFGSLWGLGFISNLAIVVGTLLLIVPGVIAVAGWMGAASALMVEDETSTEALKRSWELSRGSRWPLAALFGLALLGAAAMVVVLILILAMAFAVSQEARSATVVRVIVTPIWSLLVVTVSTVGSAAAYTGLRIAKEGDAGDVSSVFA